MTGASASHTPARDRIIFDVALTALHLSRDMRNGAMVLIAKTVLADTPWPYSAGKPRQELAPLYPGEFSMNRTLDLLSYSGFILAVAVILYTMALA